MRNVLIRVPKNSTFMAEIIQFNKKKTLVISIVWLDAKMSVLLSFLLSKLCTKMRSFQDNDDFV